MARLAALGRLADLHHKALIAVLMATLTCLATGIAALQSDASSANAAAERMGDQLHSRSGSISNSVQAENSREYMLYRYWYEQRLRANAASDRARAEQDPARARLLEDLSDIESSIEGWLETRGLLFSDAYYDRDASWVDFSAFYARSLVELTRTDQQAAREDELADQWETIANEYVSALTIVAVALFFLGLAATLPGRRRMIFVAAGLTAAVVASAWTASLATRPIHRIPDAAIEAYVRSTSELAAVGATRGLTDADREHLDAALAAAREAVDLDPAYKVATAQVAAVSTVIADRHTYAANGDPAVAARARDDAIDAYVHALEADPADHAAWWNLGYLQYFAGDYPAALRSTDEALARRPGMFALELNRAYVLLAMGDEAGADRMIASAIDHLDEAPRGEAEWYLSETDADLERLLGMRPEAERAALTRYRAQLRSAAVALRVRGTARAATGMPSLAVAEAHILTIEAGTGEYEYEPFAAGDSVGADAQGFFLTLRPAAPVPDGARLSTRVWIDGAEDTDYRRDDAWPESGGLELMSPYGAAGYWLDVGAYHVEFFLDGAKVGEFDFAVAEGA